MASDSVTLRLEAEGEIPFREFANACQSFWQLIDALSDEVSRDASIDWTVTDLSTGSALATIRGQSSESMAVERVAAAFLSVGRAQAESRTVPHSARTVRAADQLAEVLNGRVVAVRFETSEGDATVQVRRPDTPPIELLPATFGAVTGRIQTLSNRGSLRFTLYDLIFDKAVSCYLEPTPDAEQSASQEEMMRGMWGQIGIVEGSVTREKPSGRPVTVRRITNVTARREVPPGSFRMARGAVPADPDSLSAEEVIRTSRDAE